MGTTKKELAKNIEHIEIMMDIHSDSIKRLEKKISELNEIVERQNEIIAEMKTELSLLRKPEN